MFFKKPSLETMNKRKEEYSKLYVREIEWLKHNMELIKDNKFSTKNLPDAIMWHCSSYWPHIFKKKEISYVAEITKIETPNIILYDVFTKIGEYLYDFGYESEAFDVINIFYQWDMFICCSMIYMVNFKFFKQKI